MKRIAGLAAAFLALTGFQAPPQRPAAPLSLWRLDCGKIVIPDFNAFFSDTFAYKPGQPKELVASCYLIKHGSQYMLWDTGLKPGSGGGATLPRTIADQLQQIGVRAGQIGFVGISHNHGDHIGQAASFAGAKLLIGKADLDALRAKPTPPRMEPDLLKPWLSGGAKVEELTSDKDVFGDGSVVMLKMPGHTAGHYSLLVRLASGAVLLSGDLYHFHEQVLLKGVPPFNANRADTLASMDRLDRIARNLGARVIIQHEPADVAKLPLFPKAAE